MKNLFLVPFLIVFIAFSGCEAVDELKLQNILVPGKMTFNVVSTDTNQAVKNDTIDLSNNPDFMNNKSKIESLEVKDILFNVTRLDSNSADTITDGKLEVLNPVTGTFQTLTSYNKKILKRNWEEKVMYNSDIANLIINSVKNSPYRAICRYTATMNKKPVDMDIEFTVRFNLKVKI